MTQQAVTKPMYKAVLGAGIVAGTLDALAASILYTLRSGKNPVAVWKFVASGVLGEAGLKGGLGMAALGLVFHYMIATIWAFIFFFAISRKPDLSRKWIWLGVGYGVFVWLGMNLVVVPLSSTTPMGPKTLSGVISGTIVLITCVGLPIAFLARKYFSPDRLAPKT